MTSYLYRRKRSKFYLYKIVENLKTQKAREDAAKERIFSLLPEDQKAEFMPDKIPFYEKFGFEANEAQRLKIMYHVD